MVFSSRVGIRFRDLRQPLSAYVRALPQEEYYQRTTLKLAGRVSFALFDPMVAEVAATRQRCPIGAATAGLFALFFIFDPKEPFISEALESPHLAGKLARQKIIGFFRNTEDFDAVLGDILAVLHLVLSSVKTMVGSLRQWPFFALLALVAQHMESFIDPPEARYQALNGTWDQWLDSGDWLPSPEQKALAEAEVLEPHKDVCSVDFHAALITIGMVMDGGGLEAVFYVLDPWIWRCLLTKGVLAFLQPAWIPIWLGLDRLLAPRSVEVTHRFQGPDTRLPSGFGSRIGLEKIQSEARFTMELLPPHIRGNALAERGFWFLADRIRISRQPHCNAFFITLAEAIAASSSEVLNFVEVGAHLGDCCLWATARFQRTRTIRCLAVESEVLNTAAIQKSIVDGQFQDSMEVVRTTVVQSMSSRCPPPEAESLPKEMTLDCILGRWDGRANLVSLFLGNIGGSNEMSALLGALGTLKKSQPAHQPDVLLLRTTCVAVDEFSSFIERYDLPYRILFYVKILML